MHKNFTILLLAVFMLVFLGSLAAFADYGPGYWEQKTRSSNTVEELSGPMGCSPMFLVTPTTATNSTLFLQNIAGDLYLTDNAFYSSASAWTAAISTNKSMALAFDLANGTFKFNYAAAGATPSFSTVASISSAGAMSMASLTLTGALSVEGNTDLGNAAADTISLIGVVDTDLTFVKEVNRALTVGTSTTALAAGANLTISAATGAASSVGGNTVITGGAAGAGSTAGTLSLGSSNTSAITVGATGVTTTNAGALTSTQTLTATASLVANGDVDLGNAATDTVSITGVVDTDAVFIKEVARTIKVADTTTAATAGAALTVQAGYGTTNGGNLVLRAGDCAAGTDGILQLGVTNTSAITLGASAITTTSTGPLTASETLTATSAFVANGDVDLGNAATDTVTITGVIDGDVSFLKEVNRTVSIAASTTTDTVGASLTLAAANGVGTGNGGNMVVRAGDGAADGVLQLGITNTSAITLGASTITTTSTGPLTVTEALTANGNIDLGNAATDTLSLTATVDTDVTFVKEANRTVSIAASTTADTAGANLTLSAADGVGTGAGGNAVLNAGSGPGAGADGQVQIGAANTSAVAVTPDTTFTGAVIVNGNTDLGNVATDTCTITAAVDSDVTFIKEVNRTVSPAQSTTTNAAGANLTVAAAAADGNGAGGSLSLNAGDSPSGTDGSIAIGAANTNAVQITPQTNVVGNFAVNTTKLTVNATTGNTVVAGNLDVTGAIRSAKMNRIFEFDEGANLLAASAMNYWWTLGGTAGTAAIVADENGIMQLSTTATGSRSATIAHSAANFNTNNAPEFIAYVQVSNITNSKVDLGWYVDANDELIFRFDTDVDAGNIYLVSENNNGGEVVTDTGVNLTAGAYFKFRLKINADETFTAEINDVVVAAGHVGTIRQLATFKPWFYIDNKAAAEEKLMHIDYVFLSQDR